MKNLVISADDYALNPMVDDGILALIQQGAITAASCMVLSPRWSEAASKLDAEIRIKANIGLHLDFTEFTQALKHSLAQLILKTNLRLLNTKQIELAIKTQLDLFEAKTGKAPDYIDGHQHVHQLPQIRDALIHELTQRYSQKLPWIRIACPPPSSNPKAWIIKSLGANALRQLVKKHGFHCNQHLLGIYNFNGTEADYQTQLENWLKTAQNQDVLMCHPALNQANSDIAPLQDVIVKARLREYAIFTNPAYQAALKENAITLTRRPS